MMFFLFVFLNHSSSIIFFFNISNTVSYASGSDLWRQLI